MCDIMYNILFFILEEHANIWGAWHTTLKQGLQEQTYTGTTPKMIPVLLYYIDYDKYNRSLSHW